MKQQLTETSNANKAFAKPQIQVVKWAGADVICTSQGSATFTIQPNQGYEEEDW